MQKQIDKMKQIQMKNKKNNKNIKTYNSYKGEQRWKKYVNQ